MRRGCLGRPFDKIYGSDFRQPIVCGVCDRVLSTALANSRSRAAHRSFARNTFEPSYLRVPTCPLAYSEKFRIFCHWLWSLYLPMRGFPCFQDACSSGQPNYPLSRETTSDGVRPTVLLMIVSGGLGADIRCCTALRHP